MSAEEPAQIAYRAAGTGSSPLATLLRPPRESLWLYPELREPAREPRNLGGIPSGPEKRVGLVRERDSISRVDIASDLDVGGEDENCRWPEGRLVHMTFRPTFISSAVVALRLVPAQPPEPPEENDGDPVRAGYSV